MKHLSDLHLHLGTSSLWGYSWTCTICPPEHNLISIQSHFIKTYGMMPLLHCHLGINPSIIGQTFQHWIYHITTDKHIDCWWPSELMVDYHLSCRRAHWGDLLSCTPLTKNHSHSIVGESAHPAGATESDQDCSTGSPPIWSRYICLQ